jgi:hypothetical protein
MPLGPSPLLPYQEQDARLHAPLIDAIDDYVAQITGDRTALHAKNHKCG